jgi:hypothetical protein
MYLRMDELIKDIQYIADHPNTVRMQSFADVSHMYICLLSPLETVDVCVCVCVEFDTYVSGANFLCTGIYMPCVCVYCGHVQVYVRGPHVHFWKGLALYALSHSYIRACMCAYHIHVWDEGLRHGILCNAVHTQMWPERTKPDSSARRPNTCMYAFVVRMNYRRQLMGLLLVRKDVYTYARTLIYM